MLTKYIFNCTNYRISDPQNNYHLMNHYRKMETGHLNRCTVNKTRCKNDDNARSEHRIEMPSMQRDANEVTDAKHKTDANSEGCCCNSHNNVLHAVKVYWWTSDVKRCLSCLSPLIQSLCL